MRRFSYIRGLIDIIFFLSDERSDVPGSTWQNVSKLEIRGPIFVGQTHNGDEEPKAPIVYFREIIDDGILNMIVEQSNLYSTQQNVNKPLHLTKEELEQFLGITFTMSIVKMPATRMYWASKTRYGKVADVMTCQRFETIKRNLHFNDNAAQIQDPEHRDKLFKVQPLISRLREKVQKAPLTENICVDEQIIPFKGKSKLKTYNPKKPYHWGYKAFVCCTSNGIIRDFEFYTGQVEQARGHDDIGSSGNIVLQLMRSVPHGIWHHLFVDNWFNSPKLQIALWKIGIKTTGTVRLNRVKNLSLPSDTAMKREGRGSVALQKAKIDGVGLHIIKWMDSKSVTLLSTGAGSHPVSEAKRFDRKIKETIYIQRPLAVTVYNTSMGGVDLLDGLISYYRNSIRSKKWYLRIAFHLFDMMVVQAWLTYRESTNPSRAERIPLVDFKLEIADCLMLEGKALSKKRGRPSLDGQNEPKKHKGKTTKAPSDNIRLDRVSHFPVAGCSRGRCKMPRCNGFSRTKCCKCGVHLCLTRSSNCFLAFHTE